MHTLLIAAGGTAVTLLLFAWCLHLLPKLGGPGRALAERARSAPLLDAVVFIFTMLPTIAATTTAAIVHATLAHALIAFAGAILGQWLTLVVWTQLHELIQGRPERSDRIMPTLGALLGGGLKGASINHLALWWMTLAVPVFWSVRLGEWAVYPALVRFTKLPKYNAAEWVSISRHKTQGLVGADLIWCLYCDWMTGVWSLGSEMLRNIESFWCPIRFHDKAKCANCAIDFPDVDGAWVPANASMGEVTRLLRDKYPAADGTNAWLGHPVRMTVNGEPHTNQAQPDADKD